MKIRLGHVSNSSASSFILDIRTEGVSNLLKTVKERGVSPLGEYGLGRSTAWGTSEEILYFIKEMRKLYDCDKVVEGEEEPYVPNIVKELERIIKEQNLGDPPLEFEDAIKAMRAGKQGMLYWSQA